MPAHEPPRGPSAAGSAAAVAAERTVVGSSGIGSQPAASGRSVEGSAAGVCTEGR